MVSVAGFVKIGCRQQRICFQLCQDARIARLTSPVGNRVLESLFTSIPIMSTEYRDVRRWTLELRSTSSPELASLKDPIEWRETISTSDYLHFYKRVGEKWNWFDRAMMSSEQLKSILHETNREFGILQDAQKNNVGFTEVCYHSPLEVEFCYFGLFPDCIGRGLGRRHFSQIVAQAIGRSDSGVRIWLTTCEWDSPRALPFYQKMGFEIVREDVCQQQVPAGFSD